MPSADPWNSTLSSVVLRSSSRKPKERTSEMNSCVYVNGIQPGTGVLNHSLSKQDSGSWQGTEYSKIRRPRRGKAVPLWWRKLDGRLTIKLGEIRDTLGPETRFMKILTGLSKLHAEQNDSTNQSQKEDQKHLIPRSFILQVKLRPDGFNSLPKFRRCIKGGWRLRMQEWSLQVSCSPGPALPATSCGDKQTGRKGNLAHLTTHKKSIPGDWDLNVKGQRIKLLEDNIRKYLHNQSKTLWTRHGKH